MGADASLDNIIKKLTIIYECVKSFDFLMKDLKDFYRADKEEETNPIKPNGSNNFPQQRDVVKKIYFFLSKI